MNTRTEVESQIKNEFKDSKDLQIGMNAINSPMELVALLLRLRDTEEINDKGKLAIYLHFNCEDCDYNQPGDVNNPEEIINSILNNEEFIITKCLECDNELKINYSDIKEVELIYC